MNTMLQILVSYFLSNPVLILSSKSGPTNVVPPKIEPA